MHFLPRIFGCFIIFFLFSAVALADSVDINSGSVFTMSQGGVSFRFAGGGVWASGGNGGTNAVNQFAQSNCIFNCLTGSNIGVNSLVTTGNIYDFPSGNSGRVTYLGNSYLVQEGVFSFTSQVITLPAPSGVLQQYFNAPFSMTGNLELRSLSVGVPNIIVPISGTGTAILNFVYNDGSGFSPFGDVGTWSLVNTNYYFGSTDGNPIATPPLPTPQITPEPVPEPATILLLATGLAGVIGLSRRRKLQSSE